ncbi:MAG: hypothetical protein P4L33_02680 [Capsulimonadaceae bacterium]|nr:hypothetical protein [Capsulimonadaceae bacterium]
MLPQRSFVHIHELWQCQIERRYPLPERYHIEKPFAPLDIANPRPGTDAQAFGEFFLFPSLVHP